VTKITLADWEAFIDSRSSGRIDGRGRTIEALVAAWERRRQKAEAAGDRFTEPKPEPTPVRARTVEADCKWLQLVIGWGTKWRDRSGRYLVTENVLRGFELPKERNPRRPVASTDRLEALLAVADQVSLDLGDLLVVAAGTGRRLSAILNLRHGDVDAKPSKVAPYGSITWRAAHDKAGRESVVPMGPDVRAAVERIRARRPGIGEAPLFPHSQDPSKPVSRYTASRWLERAEELAGLEPQQGSAWHAFRRGWATARKHLPAVDVAKAGGWATVAMVTDIYQQADEETTLAVVLGGGELREVRGQ
jgi:integrase